MLSSLDTIHETWKSVGKQPIGVFLWPYINKKSMVYVYCGMVELISGGSDAAL